MYLCRYNNLALSIMKKVSACLSVIILALLLVIIVGIIVVNRSVIHVELPHGAVLHVLPAPKDNHTHGAVILCPGGGYHHKGKWYEGYWWFPFFYRQGYTVALLEYRLPNCNHQVPMVDGAEAIQLMSVPTLCRRTQSAHFRRLAPSIGHPHTYSQRFTLQTS